MAGLNYVGVTPTVADGILTNAATAATLTAHTPNQTTITAQIAALTSGSSPTYASKSYVDAQAANYASLSYVTTQDALNLPVSQVGQPNGVAGLDTAGTVPLSQLPVIGAGYVRGPFGPTALYTGTTNATPLKIAQWQIGVQDLPFRPLAFMSLLVTASVGHPMVEVRIANSGAAVAYGTDTLIASGMGRWLYNDYHAVAVTPTPDAVGEISSLLPLGETIWVTAWLYDLYDNSVGIANASSIPSAAVYLLRGGSPF